MGHTSSLSTNNTNPPVGAVISESALYEGIIEAIKTVYDPEFPLIDIYTMGLIYDISIEKGIASGTTLTPQLASCPTKVSQKKAHDNQKNNVGDTKTSNPTLDGTIIISMTFTTPQCPSIDMLEQMTLFAVKNKYPTYDVKLDIVWEPLRSPAMIKDEDFKKMFWDI